MIFLIRINNFTDYSVFTFYKIISQTTNHDTLLMSPPTSANTGSFPIRLLLLSNKWREGQVHNYY